MASATLRLTRRAVGIELRRRPFDVVLDGSVVGSVTMHAAAEFTVEPGSHTLRLRAGRYLSAQRRFDVADGETVDFSCHSVQIWPTYLLSLIKPDLGISLKPD
jgi:hypothetical protein